MHAVAICVACFFTGTAFGWITCAICTAAKGGLVRIEKRSGQI
jgi:hypothetical protein